MICKGNTHQNGPKLARYMTTAKEGEHVMFGEVRGFATNDITKAFRSVHVMAEATRCEQPFFHVQVRNPDGETLSREQWKRVADRIELKLGLTDQPRAITFHVNTETGHEHMHVAWSRIDGEALKGRPLPFFKERLKEVAREMEKELGLTRVKNERDSPVQAPDRNEYEQARRLGIDIREVRQTIRDCWERSDGGRSFRAALAEHNLTLAQGDRRDLVVLDHEGGLHALGKKVLGISTAEMRARSSDLVRDDLPTIAQARQLIAEKDRTMVEPHVREMAWEDALAKAAIDKEKIERNISGVAERERATGSRNPFEPPAPQGPVHPQLNKTSPQFWFEDAGRDVSKDSRPTAPPEDLRGPSAKIWTAYNQSRDPNDFAAALAKQRIGLAVVTKDEADQSYRRAAFARQIGNFAPTYKEGEVVAITKTGQVYKLNERTTGDRRAAVGRFLTALDRKELQGIEATKRTVQERHAARTERSLPESLPKPVHHSPVLPKELRSDIDAGLPKPVRKSARAIGQTLDLVGGLMESALAPILTPEQKRQGEITTKAKQADATDQIDLHSTLGRLAEQRQREEAERQLSQQRSRTDDRDR